jgi:iron complex transport system substrate-binding protein
MKEQTHSGGLTGFVGLLALVLCLLSGACLVTPAADAQERPQRIVSMNLCTDELLIRLVDPSRIASVTYLSQQPVNAPLGLGDVTSKLKVNHGLAEEVLMLKPDLVLAGRYSTTAATAMLERQGVRVIRFDPENTFDDMRANIRKMGKAVGDTARAEQVIGEFDKRLATLQAQIPPGELPVFADIGVNNYVAGADTLYAYVVHAGGYRTLGEALGFSGYRNVSLEEILKIRPGLISTYTPWTDPPSISTMALRHPALKALVERTPQITIPERYTTCGAPSVLGAVELLVEARKASTPRAKP